MRVSSLRCMGRAGSTFIAQPANGDEGNLIITTAAQRTTGPAVVITRGRIKRTGSSFVVYLHHHKLSLKLSLVAVL